MTGGGLRHEAAGQADAVLFAAASAAAAAFDDAFDGHSGEELASIVGVGGDGTPTSRLDEIVDTAVLAAVDGYGVNVLSEEVGWVDRGSALTLVVDPVDGTANALAGVPISTFSAALVLDGQPIVALTRWLETGKDWLARTGEPAGALWRTTGRRRLDGAAISLLRPQAASRAAWGEVAERAERVRVLSCSTFEAILVCTGATDAFADLGADVHRYVDLVAAQLYAALAGATLCDAFGRPFEFDVDLTRRWSGVVAASEDLAAEIVETVSRRMS